jgi:hypothetical protein
LSFDEDCAGPAGAEPTDPPGTETLTPGSSAWNGSMDGSERGRRPDREEPARE